MTLKLKGGRPVKHTKWCLDMNGLTYTSTGDDCNGGTVQQSVTPLEDGRASARVIHFGHLKFNTEIIELRTIEKITRSIGSAQGGIQTKTVTSLMGHEDIRTTLKHYAQTSPQSLLEASEALVDAIELLVAPMKTRAK